MVSQRPVVKTIGLTKRFKDFWRRDKVVAVDDLDLEIRSGEVFGLLGPNGSGKSTTIKMLLGLLYPTRGRISIFGKPPTDVATKARIGFLPEESYLYRFLNAQETLRLYGKLFQQSRQICTARIEKLLEMVGLQHQAKRRIGEYSKGMARRIGLAQALINDPDFLILDEPTTGMDPIGTQQVKELVRELAARGKTILLSSHLLSDVQDVCDRVCILYGGQNRALGEVGELLMCNQNTQITAPNLKSGTIEEIKRVIKQRENSEDVEIAHPTERLESYFVRIVQQAQEASLTTSGVEAGGKLADFLAESGDQTESVIQDLITASEEPVAGQTITVEEVTPLEPDATESVMSELLDSVPVAESAPEPVSPEPASSEDVPLQTEQELLAAESSTSEDGVDRSIIDGLISDSEENQSG